MDKVQLMAYLASVDISGDLANRVSTIFDFYVETLETVVDDIFVSEYVTQDETREYESVFFFNQSSLMEAGDFVLKDDFDMAPIKHRIKTWRITKNNYDFKNADRNSRMSIRITMIDGGSATLKASRENCDHLRDLFFGYFASNIIPELSA